MPASSLSATYNVTLLLRLVVDEDGRVRQGSVATLDGRRTLGHFRSADDIGAIIDALDNPQKLGHPGPGES
jgi:hypothetical protein